jgi:hypothetical protein
MSFTACSRRQTQQMPSAKKEKSKESIQLLYTKPHVKASYRIWLQVLETRKVKSKPFQRKKEEKTI